METSIFVVLMWLIMLPYGRGAEIQSTNQGVKVGARSSLSIYGARKRDSIYIYNVEFENKSVYEVLNQCRVVEWANKSEMLICINPTNVFIFNAKMYELLADGESFTFVASEHRSSINSDNTRQRLLDWREGKRGENVLIQMSDLLGPIGSKVHLSCPVPILNFVPETDKKQLTIKFQTFGGYKGLLVLDDKFKVLKKEILQE